MVKTWMRFQQEEDLANRRENQHGKMRMIKLEGKLVLEEQFRCVKKKNDVYFVYFIDNEAPLQCNSVEYPQLCIGGN